MKQLVTVLAACLLFSCNTDAEETPDYVAENEASIQAYVEENNLDAQRSESGLYYVVDEPGDGAQPTYTSDVTVAYKGYFLDGEVFDQSEAAGLTFNLSQVILGWTEGITYFKEGGKGLLLVPSQLGYGSYDYYGIPGGSVLVFEVELLAVDPE